VAGPLGVGSPWSAFVGSGGSAGLLRSISIALACRCSSGGRQVVLLSSVLVSRGGSLWCGGGCVSLAGCGRRSVCAPAPPRPTLPTMTPQNRKPTPPAKSRELRSPGALTPSAGRGKPPRQLTALGEPPRRLTRRLFTAFHSAPLPVGPATSRTPTAPPKRTEAAALPPARAAKPPYRSTALHCVKTAETGDSPGQRITSPSYGNARYSPVRLAPRWPPLRPGHR
jgi:hypothetical protein